MAPRQRSSTPPSTVNSPKQHDRSRTLVVVAAEPATPLSDDTVKIIDNELVAETAAELARESHDFFNLIALLFVVGTTLVNWDFRKLGLGPDAAWTGTYFYLNWATTVLYFLTDLIWVYRVPICVKSPDMIIKHHIIAIMYLSAPVYYPEYRWFMGACLSVEINTWFLILRRVTFKRKASLWPMLLEAVSLSFYLSWIVIRCFLYPAILMVFLQMATREVIATRKLWHWPMMFIPVHLFLCVLNLKWSYDLFQPIVKRWILKDTNAPIVSTGL